jgi:hypothetical protein
MLAARAAGPRLGCHQHQLLAVAAEEEANMEPILNFVAEIALWGSVALILWGAVLTLQQLSASERKRGRPWEPAGRGDSAAPGGRASLAN